MELTLKNRQYKKKRIYQFIKNYISSHSVSFIFTLLFNILCIIKRYRLATIILPICVLVISHSLYVICILINIDWKYSNKVIKKYNTKRTHIKLQQKPYEFINEEIGYVGINIVVSMFSLYFMAIYTSITHNYLGVDDAISLVSVLACAVFIDPFFTKGISTPTGINTGIQNINVCLKSTTNPNCKFKEKLHAILLCIVIFIVFTYSYITPIKDIYLLLW